jgi:hypothetical protein
MATHSDFSTQMPDWNDVLYDRTPEILPPQSVPAVEDEVLFPTLVRLSQRRRLEILTAIEIPDIVTPQDLPMIKVIREVCADVMRDSIKIGEAQIRARESSLSAIRQAVESYRARRQAPPEIPS